MTFWKSIVLGSIFCMMAQDIMSQNPALLERAFLQNSDSLMQSFLQSCDAAHRTLPQRWDSPSDSRLQPLLSKAASDVHWAAPTAFAKWKLHPMGIPIFELPRHGRIALSELEPVLDLDLRFLDLPEGKQMVWIDQELDSLICGFLIAGFIQDSQASRVAMPNPRSDFLHQHIPFHGARVIGDTLEIREQDLDGSKRSYCSSAWNHGMEPLFSAVITKGRHLAVILLNQFDRIETITYYRIGRRWHLLNRQSASEVSINCLRTAT